MNIGVVAYIIGWVLQFEAIFMAFPLITGLIYGEYDCCTAYIISACVCLVTGYILKRFRKPGADLFLREGFAAVALSWIALGVFGALPFVITGEIPNYIDALFETVSGLTTTGASILNDVEALSKSNLFWRSFTHWIGGMGVFVFILAILPLMGAHSMNLMKAESPGPSVGKLLPKVKDTAFVTYAMYFGLTVACVIALLISGMDWFESLTMSFGTMGTGGYGIYNSSAGGFSAAQQIILAVFMTLGGVNYTAYFLIITKKFKDLFSLEEVKYYLGIIIVSTTVIMINIAHLYKTLGEALRHAYFQVASIITTAGFSTVDFDTWPQLSKTILLLLMFVGACAGSTGGGFKVSRLLILVKSVRKELRTIIHPRLSKKIYLDGHPVSDETFRSTNAYAAVYILLILGSVLLVSVDNLDFTTNFSSVVSAFNNIGPGFAMTGPTHSFACFSPFSKIVLIFDMLAGRLELFPMLVLFVPSCWRKY